MKPNDKKRGIALAKSYLNKFASWDFPEGYRTVSTNKWYETVEGYIRALKRMNNKEFKEELNRNILFDRKEYRKERWLNF